MMVWFFLTKICNSEVIWRQVGSIETDPALTVSFSRFCLYILIYFISCIQTINGRTASFVPLGGEAVTSGLDVAI